MVDAGDLKSPSAPGGVPVQVRPRALLLRFFKFIWAFCLLLAFSANSGEIYFQKAKDGTYVFTNIPDSSGWLRWRSRSSKKHYQRKVILQLICKVARQTGLDPLLLRAVVEVESAYDPGAVSPAGAMGLMQIMPSTAVKLGLDDPFHPYKNLYYGARYLRQLIDRYQVLTVALAAYHAGEYNVQKNGGVPDILTTQMYIKKILKKYESFKIMKRQHKRGFCGG